MNLKNGRTRIAVLGGSFNPPHYGHVYIAKLVLDKMSVDEVWVMVALNPDKGSELVAAKDRLAMARLAFKGMKNVKVSDFEVKNNINYTADTLAKLERTGHEFLWIIGSDIVPEFKDWKKRSKLRDTEFIIVIRPGHTLPQADLKHFDKFTLISSEKLDISSTQIRERLRKDGNVKTLVPPAVLAYIREKKLYS